eukprot:Skav213877  [mRNA]  locus=scaffold2374:100997:104631:+ [translate_table: standard]
MQRTAPFPSTNDCIAAIAARDQGWDGGNGLLELSCLVALSCRKFTPPPPLLAFREGSYNCKNVVCIATSREPLHLHKCLRQLESSLGDDQMFSSPNCFVTEIVLLLVDYGFQGWIRGTPIIGFNPLFPNSMRISHELSVNNDSI